MANSLLKTLFAGNTAKLLLLDPREGEIVDINEPACVFYGREREELVGTSITALSPQPAEEILDELARAVDGCQLERLGTGQFTADGVCDVKMHTSVIEVADRKLLLSILQDVRRQRSAEQALAHERSYFRQLVDASPEGIVFLDREGRIIRSNKGFERIFGYSEDETRGRIIEDMIVPGHLLEEASGLAAATIKGIPSQRESHRRHKDGRLIPVEILGVPVELEKEQVGVFAIYRDIGHRVEGEQALRRSEAKYRTLFEESKDVVYFTRLDGTIVDMNPAGVELFEYDSLEEVLALNTDTDFYVDPESHSQMLSILREQGYVREFEAVMRTKTGRHIHVQDTCLPELNADNEIVSLRGILRDVTHQRHLEDQLRHAQKMEALGRLAGGVSHDFNNLLMVIESYCALLEAQLPDQGTALDDLAEIRRASRRAAKLTRQLLAFSRKQVLATQSLSVGQVVRDMEELLRRLMGEDVELLTDLDSRLWPVRADAGQVEQLLVNLAVNSRDAMPGGGRLSIKISNESLDEDFARQHHGCTAGDWVHLVVSDTGVGIGEEDRRRIFEPFFTTKEVGRGTGLGLSQVYGIVQQNGGFIEVASHPEQGATFHVYFPRDTEQSVEESESARQVLARGEETILLVEDEDAVRAPLRRSLELQGYTVLEAADGAEALELLDGKPQEVDLLLTDVVMPRLGGLELAETLLGRKPELKVLFISGYTREDSEEMASQIYPAGFLQKPFSPSTLARVVREVLDAQA